MPENLIGYHCGNESIFSRLVQMLGFMNSFTVELLSRVLFHYTHMWIFVPFYRFLWVTALSTNPHVLQSRSHL